MKHFFAPALCALALLTLTACGGAKTEPTPAPPPTTSASASPLPTPTPEIERVPLPTSAPTAVPTPTTTPQSTPAVLPLTTPMATADPGGWTAYTAAAEVGTDKPCALSEAKLSADGLSLCFVPLPTEEGIQEFRQSATEPPRVSVSYNSEYGVLFIKLSRTVLSSGEPESGEEDWVYDYVRDRGLSYPYAVATGSLGEDTAYFTKSAISCSGTDTTITLMLTEAAREYKVETGHRAAEMFPTVNIVFRDAEAKPDADLKP